MADLGMIDLGLLSDRQLVALWAEAITELRRRGLTRSNNNPVADYAERIVAMTLGLQLAGKSSRGYDATDAAGTKYQIKSRRITAENSSRQLGAIRNLDQQEFDYLIVIFFDHVLDILGIWRLPHSAVVRHAKYVPHTNSHRLVINARVLADPAVEKLA
jgi:hypothetical protein